MLPKKYSKSSTRRKAPGERIVRIAQAFNIPIGQKTQYELIHHIKYKCSTIGKPSKQKVLDIASAFNIPSAYKTKYELLLRIKEKCASFIRDNPFKIQSVLFPLDRFTTKRLYEWLHEHNLNPMKVVTEGNYYRARILEPYKRYTYITKTLNNGIKLVLVK
jgi:hypothetical protein